MQRETDQRNKGVTTAIASSNAKSVPKIKRKNEWIKNWQLYSMLVPGIVFFIIFRYIPLGGIVIAFQNYNIYDGILGSKWVGFENFVTLFSYPEFYKILRNTVVIALYQLIFGFPAPIILALLLNEVRKMAFKRTVQTILYLPHFLSWVIVGGLVINFLSPDSGLLNEIIKLFGGHSIFFMQQAQDFRSIVVASGIWKSVGWGTIIYLAAMAGINPELYESAEMDGAGKFRQAFSITIPTILPTIMVLLLLNIGNFLDLGFEQIYMLLNPLVRDTGEVFDTYVYRVGLLGGQYSLTTAIGLFKSIVGLILLVGSNKLSKKLTGNSIY